MPRKGENIYKRKDGRWEGRYIKARASGQKSKYGYVYAATYREVKRKLLEASFSDNPIEDATPTKPKSENILLFGTAATNWLEQLKPQVKESTYNKYRNLLESYILTELGEIILTEMTQSIVETHCNSLLQYGGKKKTGLSAKTVSDVLSVIRSVLRFSNKNGVSISLDLQSIKFKQSVEEMRVLSRNEQERLCRYLFSDLNAVNIAILVCLFTGIRIGEVCALQWEDISLSEQTIHIHQTMQRVQNKGMVGVQQKTRIVVTTPKSACSIRTIPIPEALIESILQHKTSPTGYFLTNSRLDYIEPRVLQGRFKRVLKDCAIDSANYHALRHTFATRCIELGFDVKTLSEILGHASVNITMNRYVHPSMELKKENMSRLSNLIAVK